MARCLQARVTKQNPLWYNIAAGFSSSYCFMIPVGTPGNLVVQSAAKVPTAHMVKFLRYTRCFKINSGYLNTLIIICYCSCNKTDIV